MSSDWTLAQREPLSLTPSLLARYAGGAVLALADPKAQSLKPIALHGRRPGAVDPRGRVVGYQLRDAEQSAEGPGPAPIARGPVAVVEVHSVLDQRATNYGCGWTDGYDAITERIEAACADRDSVALLLDIDSPGGHHHGCEQGALRMRRIVEASGKPCIAYVNESCFSAACWLACIVADAIHMPPSGQIGSIGCIIPWISEARALEAGGFDVQFVRAPAGKAVPAPEEALDDVGRARLQRRVNEAEASFVAAISAARGIAPEAIRALNGDTLSTREAIAFGLADGEGTFEQTLALAAELAALREAA